MGKVQLRGGQKLVKQQYYNRNVKGQMLSILPYLHRLFTVKRRCCKIRSEVYVKAEKMHWWTFVMHTYLLSPRKEFSNHIGYTGLTLTFWKQPSKLTWVLAFLKYLPLILVYNHANLTSKPIGVLSTHFIFNCKLIKSPYILCSVSNSS